MDDVLDLHDDGEELLNPEEFDEKEALGEEENGEAKARKEVDGGEGDDLYDAAIEPSGTVGEKRSESSEAAAVSSTATVTSTTIGPTSHFNFGSGRKYCLYIGNMYWWTTDADLEHAIQSTGVSDIVDIRFYENRITGQSKGYVLLVLNSEQSQKTLLEKLPEVKIHDQPLVVLPYTKQSLTKFEDAAKKIDTREKKDDKSGVINMGTVRIGPSGAIGSLASLTSSRQTQPTSLMNLTFSTVPQLSSTLQSQVLTQTRPPTVTSLPLSALLPRAPTMSMSMVTGAPPPTADLTNLSRPPPGFPIGMVANVANTSQPPPAALIRSAMPAMGGMGMGGGVQSLLGVPPQAAMMQPGLPAGAHINPQVYPTFAHGYGAENGGGGGGLPVSEAEFEEIMNRNRTVSSSAIGRAVSDAAAGDYSSAIETLVTAVSLIRQSRIAHDDRCKVLIASLQDTLQGIESKSYNSRRHRSSGRDRSRSRDRSGRKRHRSRSRSRDRYDYSPVRARRY